MKRVLSGLFATLILLSVCVTASVAAMPYYVGHTYGSFVIDSDGVVQIGWECRSDDATESVTITVKLEKRTLLLFWIDVETWTFTSNESYISEALTYSLTDSGMYRCTIEFEITSTDGTVETDEYQQKVEYDPA